MPLENITRSTDGTLLQQYSNSVSVITSTGYIDSMCGGIYFQNAGSSTLTINYGIPLLPGQSWGLAGNAHELDVTKYNISFDTSTPGTTNICVVVRKFYVG